MPPRPRRSEDRSKLLNDPFLFLPNTVVADWARVENLAIIPGRAINFSVINSPAVNYVFERRGLRSLYSLRDLSYPNLVRYFYANLRVDLSALTITSFVKGTHIHLSLGDLCDILDIPNVGHNVFFWPDSTFENYVDPSTVYATLCHRDDYGILPPLSEFKPISRFVNRVILSSLIPRDGHFEKVQPFQYLFVYSLLSSSYIINPAYVIMAFMHFKLTGTGSLPYGAFLTRIFHRFDISLDNEPFLHMDSDFNRGTFSRMHIPIPMSVNFEEVAYDNEEAPPPPPTLETVVSRLDRMEDRMSSMEERIISLQTNTEDHLSSMSATLDQTLTSVQSMLEYLSGGQSPSF